VEMPLVPVLATMEYKRRLARYEGAAKDVRRDFRDAQGRTERIMRRPARFQYRSPKQLGERRVRFEFISVLGHELKSPLGAIENYLNILKDRTLGDQLAGYDDVIGPMQGPGRGHAEADRRSAGPDPDRVRLEEARVDDLEASALRVDRPTAAVIVRALGNALALPTRRQFIALNWVINMI
jgi:signal transduction histidine kinase